MVEILRHMAGGDETLHALKKESEQPNERLQPEASWTVRADPAEINRVASEIITAIERIPGQQRAVMLGWMLSDLLTNEFHHGFDLGRPDPVNGWGFAGAGKSVEVHLSIGSGQNPDITLSIASAGTIVPQSKLEKTFVVTCQQPTDNPSVARFWLIPRSDQVARGESVETKAAEGDDLKLLLASLDEGGRGIDTIAPLLEHDEFLEIEIPGQNRLAALPAGRPMRHRTLIHLRAKPLAQEFQEAA